MLLSLSSFPVPRSYCKLETCIHHLFLVHHGDPLLIMLTFLENQVKIASLGGIEVIISAMKLHGDHKEIQEIGCKALCNLLNSGLVSLRCAAYLSCNPSNRTWLTPSQWSHVTRLLSVSSCFLSSLKVDSVILSCDVTLLCFCASKLLVLLSRFISSP